MTEPADKPPVLAYEPVEAAKPPLARRMAVGFLHVLPWLPLYMVMLVSLLWLIVSRSYGRQDEPFSMGELVADLFVAWLVLGLFVTAFRAFRKR